MIATLGAKILFANLPIFGRNDPNDPDLYVGDADGTYGTKVSSAFLDTGRRSVQATDGSTIVVLPAGRVQTGRIVRRISGTLIPLTDPTDAYIVDVRSAASSFQLPDPTTNLTPIYLFARGNLATHAIAFAPFSLEHINDGPPGTTSFQVSGSYVWLRIWSDGTDWWIGPG